MVLIVEVSYFKLVFMFVVVIDRYAVCLFVINTHFRQLPDDS